MVLATPVNHITWKPGWRIVSSVFPPKGLFDRVSSREDLDIVLAIEGLTNDRLRDEIGELSLVPEEERVYGAGASPIMAAFTHLNPSGSRFTDGTYGVYYAARSVDTAIAETRFHKERFLRATQQAPIEVDMRSYASNIIDTGFHDIRGLTKVRPDLYDPDPDHYAAPQSFARTLRSEGSNGVVYDSVGDEGGECAAVMRAKVLSPTKQGKHYCYVWNGEEISHVYVKAEYKRGS